MRQVGISDLHATCHKLRAGVLNDGVYFCGEKNGRLRRDSIRHRMRNQSEAAHRSRFRHRRESRCRNLQHPRRFQS